MSPVAVAPSYRPLVTTIAPRRRARPVLMTTAAGISALVPLALGVGSGSALLKPLANAVGGGFTMSALLLLLPALLARCGGRVGGDEGVRPADAGA